MKRQDGKNTILQTDHVLSRRVPGLLVTGRERRGNEKMSRSQNGGQEGSGCECLLIEVSLAIFRKRKKEKLFFFIDLVLA